VPAKITDIIEVANFELIRDKIGEILALELANQANLASDEDFNATVYIERFTPPNYTECPMVNVVFTNVPYDYSDIEVQRGKITYYIDVYSQAVTSPTKRGDKTASLQLHKLIRAIRYILQSVEYHTLGFDDGVVLNVDKVSNIQISEPQNTQDGNGIILGRLTVQILANESVTEIEGRAFEGSDTSIDMEDKTGYKITVNNN